MGPLILLLALSASALANVTPVVRVKQGRLQGVQEPGAPGTAPFFAFRGIPYAAKPVGVLRFKAPRPAPSWSGIRNASLEGSVCHQATFDGQLLGSEDCLYLNVYTPKLKCSSQLPVIVYFHSSAFIFGDGGRGWHGPDFINYNDVVLVVPNYRLGPFGFLNLGTSGAPGNAALKDSQAVLRWVKENIKRFCGNPDKVTVAGHSAGATIAHVNAINARSKGLFQRAILMSGSALLGICYIDEHIEAAQELATILGAKDNSTATLERTLRSASGSDINAAHLTMLMREPSPNLMFKFAMTSEIPAVSDADLPGSLFMSEDPETMIRNADVKKPVPILAGTAKEEGDSLYGIGFVSKVIQANDTLFVERINSRIDEVIQRFAARVPKGVAKQLGVQSGTGSLSRQQRILQMVRNAYAGGRSTFTREEYIKIIGDSLFDGPLLNYMRMCRGDVSLYVTDISTSYNFVSRGLIPMPALTTTTHADDLGYLFRPSVVNLNQNYSDSSEAGQVLRYISTLITDFAKGRSVGLPATCGDPSLPYRLINSGSPVVAENYGSGVSVWLDIFDLLRQGRRRVRVQGEGRRRTAEWDA
ncbi:juvenile hormone esterase-like [Thrips palmi]|uniref:Juvenile hormone esterase-like n=1 Tax=Thrips palmi TaxID=161013 RepID=A0A6P8YHE2_THRPL|nr:juvenile hormone esterase-like [Thrips palmi]